MIDLAKILQSDIENIVDRIGLKETIETLSVICFEKAEHLRSNWQDKHQARAWEHNAKALLKLAATQLVETH